MDHDHERGTEPQEGAGEPNPPNWRIDYRDLSEERRARHRRDAAGASRDIGASLLAGGL
ncbi:hypothetical protein ACFQER_16075 [Halomicroarcula sp. GCM10025894]|uniref:hypothetical protein n=1 Tax=Halomicroarcula sp. GCM10025894 TaxID=3252673 RepID=UPI00361C6858